MDSLVFNSLKSHLFIRVLKNETSYLLNSMIMFTSLFFILFMLFMSKEIFIHYSDSSSILLPKSMIVVDDNLSFVYETLSKNSISKKGLLFGAVKNYEELAVYSNINGQKSLPKSFTLLSFDIQTDKKITIECNKQREDVKILDIALKRHKDWIFKVEKLSFCKPKEDVILITQNAEIKMRLKRNETYAKLIYKADETADRLLYPFLIDLEEELFINYFAYSKFFVSQKSKLSKETQEHAKMLNSLFKLSFAKHRQRTLLNHEAYSFLTEYKKIPFSIMPLNSDYKKNLTVLDELALNITNEKVLFHEHLLLANLSSLKDIHYDKTVIFCKDIEIDESLFKNATKIYRDEFQTVKQSASLKINITIYMILYILFILMLALIKSFISRNYKLYKSTFDILVFHGFNFKIATLTLTLILLVSFMLAYFISTLLLHEVNAIFNLYYVDLILLDFEYIYIVLFFAMGILASYFNELKALHDIINKAKGR